MSPSGVTFSTSSNDSSQPDEQPQLQQQHQLPPKPPGLPNGVVRDSHESSSLTQQRPSGSLEQAPAPAGSGGQSKQLKPLKLQEAAGQSKAATYAGSYAGSKGSGGSAAAPDPKPHRASFAIDNLDPDHGHAGQHVPAGSSYAGSHAGPGSAAGSISGNQLQDGTHKAASQQRSSIDSVASKASSTGGSKRSSFALEAEPEGRGSIEMDHYGRPSFAPFEKAMAARGEDPLLHTAAGMQ